MTVQLATIRDGCDRQIAHVEALKEDQELAIRILFKDDSWKHKLADLEDGKLRFMIDGAVYLERRKADDKEFLALDKMIAGLTNGELHLEYDPVEVERGHDLKRRIAKLQGRYVPFTELLEIARQSAHAS